VSTHVKVETRQNGGSAIKTDIHCKCQSRVKAIMADFVYHTRQLHAQKTMSVIKESKS